MRVEGWEKPLQQHISEAREHGFAWGRRDCVLWCADWVRKATVHDFAEGMTGRYETEHGAALLMLELGFESVEEIADAYLPRVPVAFARRGDVIQEHPGGPLGLCDGRRSFFLTEGGVTARDTLACASAWRVE